MASELLGRGALEALRGVLKATGKQRGVGALREAACARGTVQGMVGRHWAERSSGRAAMEAVAGCCIVLLLKIVISAAADGLDMALPQASTGALADAARRSRR